MPLEYFNLARLKHGVHGEGSARSKVFNVFEMLTKLYGNKVNGNGRSHLVRCLHRVNFRDKERHQMLPLIFCGDKIGTSGKIKIGELYGSASHVYVCRIETLLRILKAFHTQKINGKIWKSAQLDKTEWQDASDQLESLAARHKIQLEEDVLMNNNLMTNADAAEDDIALDECESENETTSRSFIEQSEEKLDFIVDSNESDSGGSKGFEESDSGASKSSEETDSGASKSLEETESETGEMSDLQSDTENDSENLTSDEESDHDITDDSSEVESSSPLKKMRRLMRPAEEVKFTMNLRSKIRRPNKPKQR